MFATPDRVMNAWALKRATSMLRPGMKNETILAKREVLTDNIVERFNIGCRGTAKAIAGDAFVRAILNNNG